MDSKEDQDGNYPDSRPAGGQKMSSKLKQRLKSNSRSFTSPLKARDDDSAASSSITLHDMKPEDIDACNDKEQLQKMCHILKREVSEKEELVKQLELVETYASKNESGDLMCLIQKWLTATQLALRKLFEKIPENQVDFPGLLRNLNIDHDLVEYDLETDDFS